jgi:hypothetical protein
LLGQRGTIVSIFIDELAREESALAKCGVESGSGMSLAKNKTISPWGVRLLRVNAKKIPVERDQEIDAR